jgi:hypothetical protein
MRRDRVMEGPAAVSGDQAFDLALPGNGRDRNVAAREL